MIGYPGDFINYRIIPADVSYINSRTECNTYSEVAGAKLKIPAIVPSMRGIVSQQLIDNIENLGGVVIQPRNEIFTARQIACNSSLETAVDLAKHALQDGDILSIEIANGHMYRLLETVAAVKKANPNIFVWAGTVITAKAVDNLADYGADAAIISVGVSSVCSTTNKTGIGLPPMQTVLACREGKIPIILAGGLRETGDFCKAIAAGADACMIGGLLKGCADLAMPGMYYGMASVFEKGDKKNIEGIVERVERRSETSADVMQNLEEGLKSAMSYCNATNLNEFRQNARIVKI